MEKKIDLSSAQYISCFTSLKGYLVNKLYHTQDSMLFIDIQDNDLATKQYTLMIDGDWELTQLDERIESSNQANKDESNTEYYGRLRAVAQLLQSSIHRIENITFSKNIDSAQIFFTSNITLQVNLNKFGLLSLKNLTTQEYIIANNEESLVFYRAVLIK